MMKRVFAALLAMLLLCLAGCGGKQPPVQAAEDGLLAMEQLLGSYDITLAGGSESITRTADLRLLDGRLTYVLFPENELLSENSFDSYDPRTGEAMLQKVKQDERGEYILSCNIVFAEADGIITVSGSYTIVRGDAAEETGTITGEMTEGL